jgi:dihydroxyacid dehydratase/phosphogluconate dehydratase
MSAFGRLRIDIKKERLDANLKEEELKKTTEEENKKPELRSQRSELPSHAH